MRQQKKNQVIEKNIKAVSQVLWPPYSHKPVPSCEKSNKFCVILQPLSENSFCQRTLPRNILIMFV